MKALTICQPYAEMILRSEKLCENRSWPTRHRGYIYIHAGKSRAWWHDDDAKRYPNASWGAVIAIATIEDCIKIEEIGQHYRDNRAYMDHANGPWCWMLKDVTPIGPWPYRGAQGLFEINDLDEVANRVLGISTEVR